MWLTAEHFLYCKKGTPVNRAGWRCVWTVSPWCIILSWVRYSLEGSAGRDLIVPIPPHTSWYVWYSPDFIWITQHWNSIGPVWYLRSRQTDRQTFYWQKRKVITDLFVIEMKEIYVHVYIHVYKIVNLLESYDNVYGMTYTTKIMLTG